MKSSLNWVLYKCTYRLNILNIPYRTYAKLIFALTKRPLQNPSPPPTLEPAPSAPGGQCASAFPPFPAERSRPAAAGLRFDAATREAGDRSQKKLAAASRSEISATASSHWRLSCQVPPRCLLRLGRILPRVKVAAVSSGRCPLVP